MSYVSQDLRRRQLIEAAVRVMQRDGVGHVTTRAIASEAGAPLASIHYTFGAKEDILRAAFEHVIGELLAELEAAISPGRGMSAAVTAVFARIAQLLDDPRFGIVLADLTPSSDPWMRDQLDVMVRFGENLLRREARAAGEPAPTMGYAQAGRLLMAAIDGLVMQFEMHRDAARTRSDLNAMGKVLGASLSR
jgi:AcrR family transcriptional regulator